MPENNRKIYPQNLHLQFHGREIHSLCFIHGQSLCSEDENHGLADESSWLATGCEDGTVRLTRYLLLSLVRQKVSDITPDDVAWNI